MLQNINEVLLSKMATIGEDVSEAIELLRRGELVAIPTETVYGLAANALDQTAVTKIFVIKQRPTFDPLIIHVGSIEQAEGYVHKFPDKALQLAKVFWPGPLTLVLPKQSIIPDIVTSGLGTVGIRCPNHPFTSRLLAELEFPLAAPSANPFGYVSPTTAQHVDDQLGDKIKYILDGGSCQIGLESTIVGFENKTPTLYRRGAISVESIENIIGPIQTILQSTSNPIAPGQLESHYAPRKPIYLGDITSLKKDYPNKVTGVLRFKKTKDTSPGDLVLSEKGNLEEAAQNLFATLRQLDRMDVEIILAEEVPNIGIGMAINDRLQRAASK